MENAAVEVASPMETVVAETDVPTTPAAESAVTSLAATYGAIEEFHRAGELPVPRGE